MKSKSFYYIHLFPLLFIFPTVNLLAYVGIVIPQITFSNISIFLFIILSLTYKKIDKKMIIIILFFLLIMFFSELIGSTRLSSDALIRSFISIIYYFYIIFIAISIYKTLKHFYKLNNMGTAILIIKKIGYSALLVFYMITIYQYVFKTSPALLSSDPTLGYRDFRNPLIDNVHNYNVFRALGSFPEPSMYAGFIVTLLPIMLKNNNFIVKFIIWILVFTSILLTYSRIGIFLLVILFSLFFLLSNKKIYIFIISILFSLLIFGIDYFYLNGEYLFNNIVRLFNLFEGKTDVSIQTRIMAPLKVIEYVDMQILPGYGLGSLVDIFPKLNLSNEYLQFKVPTLNNLYLNFIIEFGLISFILILIYFLFFIYKLIYYKVHKKYKYEFISLLVILAYFFQVGHLTMFYMYFILIYFITLNYFYLQKERTHANPK